MDAGAVGTLLETLGLPLGIIATLVALIWFLVTHIVKNTVSTDVYNRTCDDQKTLEQALAQTTSAIGELAAATVTTNELVRIIVRREVQ